MRRTIEASWVFIVTNYGNPASLGETVKFINLVLRIRPLPSLSFLKRKETLQNCEAKLPESEQSIFELVLIFGTPRDSRLFQCG